MQTRTNRLLAWLVLVYLNRSIFFLKFSDPPFDKLLNLLILCSALEFSDESQLIKQDLRNTQSIAR